MRYLFCLVFVAMAVSLSAQGTDMFGNPIQAPAKKADAASRGELNRVDEKGLKQGPWEKLYENGRPAYKATFKDGKPVGLMTRYYTSGKEKVRIDYGKMGECGHAQVFNESGVKIAQGIYRNNQKDSIWTFFYPSGSIAATESYTLGIKNGKNTIYYPNGRVSEEIIWANGKKDGYWLQFFESGKIKLESANKDDKIHGSYKYYFENGKIEVNGLFQNGLEHGIWTTYLEDGTLSQEMQFDNGKLKNEGEFDEQFNKKMLEWEKNKDRLRDPEKLVNDPDALMQLR